MSETVFSSGGRMRERGYSRIPVTGYGASWRCAVTLIPENYDPKPEGLIRDQDKPQSIEELERDIARRDREDEDESEREDTDLDEDDGS